ncbi:MAG: metallophosphoesterase [Clostridia bacterium]|nr:metallophosphoesterase [Clostridia bacterium]
MLRGKHIKHRPIWLFGYLALILVVVVLLAYPFFEPYLLQVEQHTVTSADLPQDIRQLRIAYVSDLHVSGFPWFTQGRAASLVSTVNGLNPDIVLLGGDYTDRPDNLVRFFRELPAIHSSYGVYAVLGEADHKSEISRALLQTLKLKGITLLNNAVQEVRVGQRNLYLVGADPLSESSYDLDALAGRVVREDFVILLSHSPEIIDNALRVMDRNDKTGWFDLGLFGHTHAGQLPFGLQWLHIADEVPEQHQRGWVEENRIPMLISNGVGTSRLPIRIGCPPTVHLITIRNR